MVQKELLDELARRTGCICLSELREDKRRKKITKFLPDMIDKDYSMKEWNDMISYIYEEERNFSTEIEAMDFVLKQEK